jgi:hypothetical protein
MWTQAPVARRIVLATMFILALSGCSVTETVKDFLSSTTPGDWFDADGMPKADYRVHLFVAVNLENVKADMAKGQGEYLTALGTLLAVPAQREAEFFSLAQGAYPSLAADDRVAVERTLIALSRQAGGRSDFVE